MQALNLKPDLLVGDLDSVTPEQIRWSEEVGAEVRKYPVEKDETDLELALQEAVARVTGLSGNEMKTRMRTGTVVSTDDRNWELKSKTLYARFNQSRAIAIDMESATVAANGFRLRVPYGTLLCVSDKPLHGELKLRGMANAFYRQRVSQHMTIGLEAIRILRESGVEALHSRKLRSFDEPAFR